MDKYNRKYTSGKVTVYWKPTLCIHSTICYTELPDVFKPSKRPWVDMEGASTEAIIETVKRCPTGALTYKMNKDMRKGEDEEKPGNVGINILPDGPYLVVGDFEIIGPDGKKMKKMKKAAFCRCGASKNKPFCDGRHVDVDFKD